MKISVASEGTMVSQHFGHCEGFHIFTVTDNQVIKKDFMPNPGHAPGLLPNLLHNADVNVIIAGGMGGGAVEIFNEHNIAVVTGAAGNVEDVVKEYLNGNLKSSNSICSEHQHSGECGH